LNNIPAAAASSQSQKSQMGAGVNLDAVPQRTCGSTMPNSPLPLSTEWSSHIQEIISPLANSLDYNNTPTKRRATLLHNTYNEVGTSSKRLIPLTSSAMQTGNRLKENESFQSSRLTTFLEELKKWPSQVNHMTAEDKMIFKSPSKAAMTLTTSPIQPTKPPLQSRKSPIRLIFDADVFAPKDTKDLVEEGKIAYLVSLIDMQDGDCDSDV
jgi:hypothetical protein